jgi:hypothetical protein
MKPPATILHDDDANRTRANHRRAGAITALAGDDRASNNQSGRTQTTRRAAFPGQLLLPRDEWKKSTWNWPEVVNQALNPPRSL